MPFADIVGHERQLASLRLALETDRLHHAYVFTGPEGVGKKTVALALAKALHCSEAKHDFCGRCANCVKIDNHNHPDVRVVSLLPKKNEISIEQVRVLEKELSYRAFSGGKKVAIIDPAPLMNLPAQNALLKTLEEPPAGSLLILIAASAGGLLPTLLSRCLRLSFAPLPARAVVDYLISRQAMAAEEAALVAAASLGSLGRARSPDLAELGEKRKAWVAAIGNLAQGGYGARAALAEGLGKEREDAFEFLEWLRSWCRDLLILRATGSEQDICNLDAAQTIRRQSQNARVEGLLALWASLAVTEGRIRRNVNRRLALEDLLAQVAGVTS
jgi:DNA polymerase-3 subunit delta'